MASPREALEPLRLRVACLPEWHRNPYLGLLYRALAPFGLELTRDSRFTFRWLWNFRHRVDLLHFHWQHPFYVYRRRPQRARRVLSWATLPLFALRLVAARTLGYRIAWTIHQVFPHEMQGRLLHRLAARLLARYSDVLFAHDAETATTAWRELGRRADRVVITPLGPFTGVYPPGRSREAVRSTLEIPSDSFVFLSFGGVRRYKDIDVLLEAFSSARLENAVLIVAGWCLDHALAGDLAAAAADDSRIKPMLDFVPDDRVAELFAASDVTVVARGDGGTSAALMLALSMGVPVIAARRPAYAELTNGEEAAWFFPPRDVPSLRAALELAAGDPEAARLKGLAARRAAERRSWTETAERIVTALSGAGIQRRPTVAGRRGAEEAG